MRRRTPKVIGEARDALELWRFLIDEGGLDPEDYDADLVQALRGPPLVLPADLSVSDALTISHPTIEAFVQAFLRAAQPYVLMWGDLLAMYEKAAASLGGTNLRIRYNFSEASGLKDLQFDLAFFRQVLRVVEMIVAPFDLSSAQPASFWNLTRPFQAMGSFAVEPPPTFDSWRRFVDECLTGQYPTGMPPLPPINDEHLAALVQEALTLADIVRADLRHHFGSYQAIDVARNVPDEPISFGLSKRVLRNTEHDHWLPTFVSSMVTAIAASTSDDWNVIANGLDDALAELRNQDANLRAPAERLEEFLQLPLWRFRHDLYSNWVCAAVLQALSDQDPLLHCFDGSIVFAFSGTHLATFNRFMPRIHLWTELRTRLERPIGKRQRIQPDIVIRRDPLTAGLNPLVVECKQYKRADNRSFGEALSAYAIGHPDAMVILADYGAVTREILLEYVPEELHERIVLVPHLHPASAGSVEVFKAAIRSGLKIASPPETTTSASTGLLELARGPGVRDLDLHLVTDDPPWHVFFGNEGSLESEPYARLENDDRHGPGHEVIKIERWLRTRYQIEVHNYSREARIPAGLPVVTVSIGNSHYEYHCPPELAGYIWRVCAIDGMTLEVRSN